MKKNIFFGLRHSIYLDDVTVPKSSGPSGAKYKRSFDREIDFSDLAVQRLLIATVNIIHSVFHCCAPQAVFYYERQKRYFHYYDLRFFIGKHIFHRKLYFSQNISNKLYAHQI